MKQFRLINSGYQSDKYFTELEFIEWYNKSPVYGIEPYTELMNNIKDPKYSNGYYIGMGYRVIYSPEQKAPEVVTEQKSVCQHKNKYFNKISNTLQFWVCPDCKQEVTENTQSSGYNPNWWIGV